MVFGISTELGIVGKIEIEWEHTFPHGMTFLEAIKGGLEKDLGKDHKIELRLENYTIDVRRTTFPDGGEISKDGSLRDYLIELVEGNPFTITLKNMEEQPKDLEKSGYIMNRIEEDMAKIMAICFNSYMEFTKKYLE